MFINLLLQLNIITVVNQTIIIQYVHKYKSAKCYFYQKVDHMFQAYQTNEKDKPEKLEKKHEGIGAIEE